MLKMLKYVSQVMRNIIQKTMKILFGGIVGILFVVGFFVIDAAYAEELSSTALFLHNPKIEIVSGARENESFKFELDGETTFFPKQSGSALDIQIAKIENGNRLTIDYQTTKPLSLREFTLRFDVENRFDTYYRFLAGQWELFDLEKEVFFGQELILFNSVDNKGLLIIFGESYGKLQLRGGGLTIDYLDGRNAKIDGLRSDIYFFPISQVGVENNLIYESKFPDGKETIMLYSADDLHAVFDEKFMERIKYFDLLKEKDPSFKTTFLIVADIFRKRGEPINPQLISELKSRGYINFGYHGVYHAYPVDDSINPVVFDKNRVDFNGTNSKNLSWLQGIISKGIKILTEQGFDPSVFRAPQYQYSDESFEVLADNGVHLAHVCQGDIYNPIRVATEQGWLWKIYDNPCNRGYVKIENEKQIYDTMNFQKNLALNGKETSFHVHIWELWSGDNPYNGNAEYHTFDKTLDYLAFLKEKDMDYNWQYAADYYQYLESLQIFRIINQQQNSNNLTATLTIEKPLQTNVYLKLLLKDGQFVKSARMDGENIKFSQHRKNLAIFEVPFDSKNNSILIVEFTNDEKARIIEPIVASPTRDIQQPVYTVGQRELKHNQESEGSIKKNLNCLDTNVVILIGLFSIYLIMFSAGLLRYRIAKKNV